MGAVLAPLALFLDSGTGGMESSGKTISIDTTKYPVYSNGRPRCAYGLTLLYALFAETFDRRGD